MSGQTLLPPRITCLGEAMRPVLDALVLAIKAPVRPTTPVNDMVNDVLLPHFDRFRSLLNHLGARVNALMGDVIAREDASDAEVCRAVGRFVAFLDELVAGYQELQGLDARAENREARDLMVGVYRHALMDMRDCLADLVATLADPIAALTRRGLPTTGQVELPLTLTMTTAPEMAKLMAWAERQSARIMAVRPPEDHGDRGGLGFWDTIATAIIFWNLGKKMSRDDD